MRLNFRRRPVNGWLRFRVRQYKVTHDPRFFPTCRAVAAGWRVHFYGLRRRPLGRRSNPAFHPIWSILERHPSIQPARVSGLGGEHGAMALDQRGQGHFGAAGFRGYGRARYFPDAPVPASQAVDRLFARLSRNAALPPLCFIVRRNGALAADLKTYIMPETAGAHAFGKRTPPSTCRSRPKEAKRFLFQLIFRREKPMLFMRKTTALPSAAEALPGRATPIPTAASHFVNGRQLQPPYPQGLEQAVFGLGCFWGAGRKFWELGDGIYTTAVGYAGGHTADPTPEQVCSGRTGHTEAVLVVFDPRKISYDQLLKTFWGSHNPTQGMRQGNDVGTQYRSAIYTFNDDQRTAADASKAAYQKALAAKGLGAITTEIAPPPQFYFAHNYHPQYLATNPPDYSVLSC